MTKHAEEVGADYAIMINPVYGAHDDDEIFLYFKTICDQVDIGISLFNQPKSGTTLSPELIERLCQPGQHLLHQKCGSEHGAPERSAPPRRG